MALPLLASLGLSVPALAQTVPVVPFGTTVQPQEWLGGTGTSQWNNQNNWARPGSNGSIHDGVPLVTAYFTGLTTNTTVRDQNSQSIGQLIFTAPGYLLSLENGTTTTVYGTGFVIDDPNNRPIVNVGVVGGGTFKFTNAATGSLAKFVIASNGTLDMSGRTVLNGMTSGEIDNAGKIIIANSDANSVGNTLTVFGPYTGNSGSIYLRTVLQGDSSPSDKLVIDGGTPTIDDIAGAIQATGNTLLYFTPGPNSTGDYTTNGILVVDAANGGTTAEGAFSLGNAELRAGAFDYRLFRGGIDGSNPDDWFLRSTFTGGQVTPPTVLPEPIEPPVTPPSVLPQPITPPDELPPDALPEDLPPVLPPGLYPIIGPEIATYGAVQPTARQLGLATLGTLHERIGDTLVIGNGEGDGTNRTSSVWGRLFGEQINNHYRAFADPRTDGNLGGFQTGVDLLHGEWLPGHSDVAGIYFAYGHADVDVTGLVTNDAATNYELRKTGSLNLNGWSGGAYWTHYGPTGWYLDAVLQGTAYEGSASTDYTKLSTDGAGFAASLEAGYPISIPALGSGFVLEPQAQIVWQHVSFDDDNDDFGKVALGSTSGASGRIGLRGRWTVVSDGGQVWQPYLRANLWQDWGAQATTTYSGATRVPLLEEATRVDLSAGLTTKINAGLSLYAQAGYQFAVGDTDGHQRDGARADFGLRYRW
ncbi:autotransporter outer membrane beta-barrel domain-containing protein [Rhizobium mayense]|uniref:Autotransporter outer membrane beta-barrel domain-containing protein n=1 Tax=Rhizobium mayense TaxID=1312184 RepID=A0ABT7JV58_9HYPH|nr:autotransporter outer membrane beta-barrel domain-containing protein [Rhizobium mayense]MDL2399633.1 autotransporter outer membrane beta-barrel domain-containing protein [Rhizobium mayense]